jgi:hypothetical protein
MTKQIILDNEFTLETDGRQWILRYNAKRIESVEGKDKEVTSSGEWYCGNIAKSLRLYLEKSLKKTSAGSIKELLEKIKAAENRIEQLFSGRYEDEKKVLKGDILVEKQKSPDTDDSVEDVLGDMF